MNLNYCLRIGYLISLSLTLVYGSAIRRENFGGATTLTSETFQNELDSSTVVPTREKRDVTETVPNDGLIIREGVTDASLNDVVYDTTVVGRFKREAVTEVPQSVDNSETTVASRQRREAVTDVTQSDDISETTIVSRERREAVTEVPQSVDSSETTVASRQRREAVTETTQSDDISETTVVSRERREAVTEVPQSADNSETTVASRERREAVTDVTQSDDISETTVVSRERREAVTEVPQSADNSETTVISRQRREAVTDVTQSDDISETTFVSRERREAVTDVTQSDDISETTVISRERREVVTEVPQSADNSETTIVSRQRREAVTDTTQSDDISETTVVSRERREAVTDATSLYDLPESTIASREKREATTDAAVSYDLPESTILPREKREAVTDATASYDIPESTILPREKREVVTDATASYDLPESTILPREKRETGEIATESIGSNEITERPDGSLRSVRSVIDDSDTDDFKYPTTPYPTDDNSTVSPTPSSDNLIPPESTKDVSVQNVIVGNRTCKCGIPTKKIVGGEDVPIAELPWTVALVRKSNKTRRGPYCGGTLVSNRYVATASHCVDGFEAGKIEVWLNEQDFRVDDENMSGTLRVDVEEIIMHPAYDRRKIDNDIALLRLAEPIDIDGAIRPVCIPADNTNTFEGEEGIVAGWGAKEQGGSVSATLQKVSVPILANKVCNWRTLYLGKITDNQLCAGELASGGKDSCQGDSGGPLIVNREVGDNPHSILVGVVSYGYGCARPLAPGVYTRVSQYPAWILENSPDAEYCGP